MNLRSESTKTPTFVSLDIIQRVAFYRLLKIFLHNNAYHTLEDFDRISKRFLKDSLSYLKTIYQQVTDLLVTD